MFSWVCSRCGHEVPPSKTECPFCTPPAHEPVAAAAAPQPQYQPPPPQYAPPVPPQQAPPQQYAQQAPPQYWQPQGPPPPPQYPPQGPPQQYPPQYAQQVPPQYWQPQQYPPQQYAPPQYQPQEAPPQQYQPPPSPTPPAPEPPQYQAPPPPQQYAPAPPQYTPPAPVAEYRQPEPIQNTSTPWPPEEQAGKPAWLVGAIAFVGVLALLGLVYFLMGSHGSSAAKDAAKQQTTNPLQKYIEVVGIRIVGAKGGETVKYLVVNHGVTELADVTANVTLWASTQRSEEDSVGTFTFHVDTLGPNESKELSAPLKTEKGPADMPEDWRNVTADVQVAAAQ